MKNVCFHCGKGIIMGRSHTHHRGVAGGRWKKRAPKTAKAFAPNLQIVKVMVNGVAKRVKLCTKCIKRVRKDVAENKMPFVRFATLEKTAKGIEKKAVEAKATGLKLTAKKARAKKSE